jgi:predicted nucleic acid-binding Zn ribbon protein
MENKDPQILGPILADLIKNMGFEKKLSELNVVKIWGEVVGEKIASISEAVKISDGRLTVRVPDPSWKQQLIYLKKEFIAAINARMGKAVVKDIFII